MRRIILRLALLLLVTALLASPASPNTTTAAQPVVDQDAAAQFNLPSNSSTKTLADTNPFAAWLGPNVRTRTAAGLAEAPRIPASPHTSAALNLATGSLVGAAAGLNSTAGSASTGHMS